MRAPATDLPIVLARRARSARGDVAILDDVSLRFAPGAPTVVIGPNGSGKTTLLRLAMGLHRAERAARSPGADASACRADAPRHRVPAAGDAAPLRRRQLAYALAAAGVARAERAARVDELLDAGRPRATSPTGRRGGSPAASSSGWRSRARWRATRRCCSSTSRPRASIRPPPRRSRIVIRAVARARHQGRDVDPRSRPGARGSRARSCSCTAAASIERATPRCSSPRREPPEARALPRRRAAGDLERNKERNTTMLDRRSLARRSPPRSRVLAPRRALGAGQVDRRRLDHLDAGFRPVRPHPAAVQGEDRHRREGGGAGHRPGARHRPARRCRRRVRACQAAGGEIRRRGLRREAQSASCTTTSS